MLIQVRKPCIPAHMGLQELGQPSSVPGYWNGLSSSFLLQRGSQDSHHFSSCCWRPAGRDWHIAELSLKHRRFPGTIHYINTRCYCILPVVNSWIAEKVKSIIYLQILSLIQMCDNSGEGKIRLCSIVSKGCMPQKKKSHTQKEETRQRLPLVEHRPLSISAVLSSVQEKHHPGVWICFSSLSCCFCQEMPCCLFVLPGVLMAMSTERIENPSLSRRGDWTLECLLLLNSFVSCWTVCTRLEGQTQEMDVLA